MVSHPRPGQVFGGFEKAIGAEAAHRPSRQRRSRRTQHLAKRVHVVLGRLI
jgi:hypothetical protein